MSTINEKYDKIYKTKNNLIQNQNKLIMKLITFKLQRGDYLQWTKCCQIMFVSLHLVNDSAG